MKNLKVKQASLDLLREKYNHVEFRKCQPNEVDTTLVRKFEKLRGGGRGLGGGPGFVLLVLPAFLPSVIYSLFTQNKGEGPALNP